MTRERPILSNFLLSTNAVGDLRDDAVRGEGGAFLPAGELAEVVAGEIDAAFGLVHLAVSGLGTIEVGVGEGAETVRNRGPGNVDRFGQLATVTAVEFLDRGARGFDFGGGVRQTPEGGGLAVVAGLG